MRTRGYILNTILSERSIEDRLRGYDTWISARNLSNEIPDDAVESLVDTIVGRYDVPQRFYALKAKLLGLPRLADYDRFAPLQETPGTIPWDEAQALVLESFDGFSTLAGEIVGRFFERDWIDAPPRPGKILGAFCATLVPDVHPYVLMNYAGERRSVLTLAHELGHGLHGVLAQDLGLLNASTPLTLAETASVFAEALTFEKLMEREDDPHARLDLLVGRLEDTIATVFRRSRSTASRHKRVDPELLRLSPRHQRRGTHQSGHRTGMAVRGQLRAYAAGQRPACQRRPTCGSHRGRQRSRGPGDHPGDSVSWRRIGIPALDALIGAGVFYGAAGAEAKAMTGREAFIVGAGNSAGQAALHLARYADSVTMLVRRANLTETMSQYLIREIQAATNIAVRFNVEIVDGGGTGRLEWISLVERTSGRTSTVPANALFLMIGAEPHTDWLPDAIERDERGFLLTGRDLTRQKGAATGWPLERAPLLLETSMPGVFAVGDVRYGSVKRVASAVGEGAIAVTLVHEYVAEIADHAR